MTLLINKLKLHDILQSQEQENISKDMDFRHSREIYPTNMGEMYWKLLEKQDQML